MKRQFIIFGIMLIGGMILPSLAAGEESSAREERDARTASRAQDKQESSNDSASSSSRESAQTGKSAKEKEEKSASRQGSVKSQPSPNELIIQSERGEQNFSEQKLPREKRWVMSTGGSGIMRSGVGGDSHSDPAGVTKPGREASADETTGRGQPKVSYHPGYSSTSGVPALSPQDRAVKAYSPLDAWLEPERWGGRQSRTSSALDKEALSVRTTRGNTNPAPKSEGKPAILANNSEAGKVHSPADAWLNPEQWQSGEIHPVPNLNTDRFRSRVRQDNADSPRDGKGDHPVIVKKPDGEKVSAVFFDRHRNPVVGSHYGTIHQHFGKPKYDYCYLPRSVNTYNIAYRKGYRDGFRDGLHYRPYGYGYGRPICSSFYFGFYFDNPYYFDFWYAGYYPNIYHYYGWVPRWCRPPGIAAYDIDPYPYSWQRPVYYYYQASESRVDAVGARETLVALVRAWEQSEIDYLADYLREGENISIYFDNEYSYSLPAEDFYTMTLDAMSTVRTLSLAFDDPIWLNPNEFFVTGRHIFVSPDNLRQTVYVSYRLHHYGGRWCIIAAGSSPQPIAHEYQDFRYQ